MKRILLAAAFAGLTGISCGQAADLGARPYAKAPAMVDPATNWSGFYVGVNAGAGWGQSDVATSTVFDPVANYFVDAPTTAQFNATGRQRSSGSGFIGGGQAGFNWQTGSFVVGLETDFDYFRQRGATSVTAIYPTLGTPYMISHTVASDWLWTLRPRIGVASGSWLYYLTGGVALTRLSASSFFLDSFLDTESASFAATKLGWTAGGGVEYALRNGWSVKAEYLHVDFGSVSATTRNLLDSGTIAVPRQPFSHSVDLRSNIVRAGLNYNFGGPVAAKY